MQRRIDELRDALVVDGARLARAQFVVQAIDAPFKESSTPFTDCGTRKLQSSTFGRPIGMLVSPVPLIPTSYANIDQLTTEQDTDMYGPCQVPKCGLPKV